MLQIPALNVVGRTVISYTVHNHRRARGDKCNCFVSFGLVAAFSEV